MTVLGKLLSFMNLFLALVWGFLTINAFATRTNWQAEAKKYQEQAQLAADSANRMKGLLDAEREAQEDAKRSLQQERDRYYAQVAELLQTREQLLTQYNIAFTDSQKKAAEAANLQAMIEKLTVQVNTQGEEIKKKDDALTKAVTEKNTAIANKETSDLEVKALKTQLEAKNLELQAASDKINELKTGTTGIPGARTPNAPQNFRGTVQLVRGEFVEISPGQDAGLQEGTVLRVERLGSQGIYLGKLRITLVTPKGAAGIFEPAIPGAPRNANNTPQRGDQVSPVR